MMFVLKGFISKEKTKACTDILASTLREIFFLPV
jgi:hypothetical protein